MHIRTAKRLKPSLWRSLPGPMEVLIRLADLLATWEQRARERRHLAEMSNHMLKDLGISRTDARREAEKPFWRV